MESAIPGVEDHTRRAVIAANPYAMATCPVLLARNPAKSAAITQNAASSVMNLARHVLMIVLGPVHIADAAPYHVQCHAIYYHAPSVVPRCWLVGIDVQPFVGRSVQVLHIAKFVRTQQLRKWLLTLSCPPLSGRLTLMRILALCHPVDTC